MQVPLHPYGFTPGIENIALITLSTGGGAKQKSPAANQYIDPASSSILKQQQVFLQLQILQNHQQLHQQLQPQQQITVVTRYVVRIAKSTKVKSSGSSCRVKVSVHAVLVEITVTC